MNIHYPSTPVNTFMCGWCRRTIKFTTPPKYMYMVFDHAGKAVGMNICDNCPKPPDG